jgi:hypothetical protein
LFSLAIVARACAAIGAVWGWLVGNRVVPQQSISMVTNVENMEKKLDQRILDARCAKIEPHVVEAILNHVSGAKSGKDGVAGLMIPLIFK